MNRIFGTLALVAAMASVAVACGPTVGVPASAVAYNAGCYQQQATVYQQATVAYAYPLAVLAIPAVTVPVQQVQPAPAVVPPAAPQQPAQALPAPQQDVSVAPAVTPVIVQRQVVAQYAYAAAPVLLNSVAYSAGYGGYGAGAAVIVNRGIFHRGATVVVRAQRQRHGLFGRIRANRQAVRAQRAVRRVPAAQVIIH